MGVLCCQHKDKKKDDNKVEYSQSRKMNYEDEHIQIEREEIREYNANFKLVNQKVDCSINNKDNFYKIGPKQVLELPS